MLVARRMLRSSVHRLASRRLSAPGAMPCTYEGLAAERTFVAFKPDTLQRCLLGAQIGRFEARGLKLLALKMLTPTRELAEAHYARHRDEPFFERVCIFLSSGPIVASVWEGRGAVGACRAMIGVTEPLESAPGTIRGDYGVHWRRNLVHGSDSLEAAEREIAIWFEPHELLSWDRAAERWLHELPGEVITWSESSSDPTSR